MTSQLRCLAVQQPFAWALCANVKNIENRTWTTKQRGTIVIVASSATSQVKRFQKDAKPAKLSADHLTVSAAIGLVDIVDVVPLNPSLESNPWAFGPYCWQLANGRLFKEPITCKGKLNLYLPDDDLAAKISQQVPSAKTPTLDTNGSAWIAAMTNVPADERIYARMDNYIKLDDLENVLRMSASGLALNPDDFDFLANQAEALSNLGRDAEALPVLDRLASMQPDNPAIYHLRGMTYAMLGEVAKSEQDQATVLKLDPIFYDNDGSDEDEGEQD
ncbi:MAG: hypothetical protein IPJ25_09720 [Rhodocyclaceae bacterium]|nr:hypothetical protein [Rhodocyclaceae bacterium]